MALYRGETRIGGIGNATTYVTQSEYDCLPSTKLTNNVNYGIYDGTPGKETINKFIKNGVSYFAGGGESKYGDGSDGDVTITEDTILNAGQQYQFNNLTICPGATVSFSGEGGAKIRVSGLFHNMGTIDMTNIDVQPYEYMDRDTMYKIYNTTWDLGIEFGKGGKGGKVYHGYNCCEVTGSRPDGCDATENCGGAGGQGSAAGGTASGNNGGNGGSGYAGCIYGADVQVIPGGAGGGGRYDGNGGNGGDMGNPTCWGCNGTLYATGGERYVVGGNGGNGGILGNGGKGGDIRVGIGWFKGGRGGDGYCGGAGGNAICFSDPYGMRCGYNCGGEYVGEAGDGGDGYYGGKGGCGYQGRYGINSASNQFVISGGKGGKGGRGLVPGAGGDGGPRDGVGGEGGEGASYLYSLNLKTNCFCNEGCILSVGAVGGQGGKGSDAKCYTWYGTVYLPAGAGGKGGKGGQGGMMQILTNCILEKGTISVGGGVGGAGGIGGNNCSGCGDPKAADGAVGETGNDGTLYFYQLEG